MHHLGVIAVSFIVVVKTEISSLIRKIKLVIDVKKIPVKCDFIDMYYKLVVISFFYQSAFFFLTQ